MKALRTLTLALLFVLSSFAQGLQNPIENLSTIIDTLYLDHYYQQSLKVRAPIKVAILDNGFYGHEEAIGKTLPDGTGPVENAATKDPHGTQIAELLTAVMTGGGRYPQFEPELHLYNTNGYSNLESAINDVIKQGIDIVVYAQVWEYGGNGDGRGFINTLIDRAIDHGILWFNAAGNFHQFTHKAAVATGPDDWVKLPSPNQGVRFRCKVPEGLDGCQARVVLSWNDFKDVTEIGTNKDLDLVLSDDTLRILQTAALKQTTSDANVAQGTSLYPREIIEYPTPKNEPLKDGIYVLRVKNRSKNFDPGEDWLRLSLSGVGIELVDKISDKVGTVLPPADNPGVITVGAYDFPFTSVSPRLGKPEIYGPSRVQFTEGKALGTSTAVAIIAGATALNMAVNPAIQSRRDVLTLWSNYREPGHQIKQDRLEEDRQVTNFDDNCPPEAPVIMYPALLNLIHMGARPVETRQGVKVYTPFPPEDLWRGYPVRRGDSIAITPYGLQIVPRSYPIHPPAYKLVYQPDLCSSY